MKHEIEFLGKKEFIVEHAIGDRVAIDLDDRDKMPMHGRVIAIFIYPHSVQYQVAYMESGQNYSPVIDGFRLTPHEV